MTRVVAASGLAVVGLGALLAGPTAFTVLVLAVAVAVLVDTSVLLGRAGARPVLPVALVPGVVLPALIARDVAADPAAGWDRVPGAFALAFLLAFLLVLVFGRRAGVVMGLAATATASLLVGLGASAVVLLRGLPSGVTWVLALAALVVAADVAGPLVRRIGVVSGRSAAHRLRPAVVTPAAALIPPLVAVAVVALVLGLLIGPPLDPLVLVLLALLALVAALGGGYLERGLAAEAGVPADRIGQRVGEGLLLGPVDALLIAAPAAYVLARSVAL